MPDVRAVNTGNIMDGPGTLHQSATTGRSAVELDDRYDARFGRTSDGSCVLGHFGKVD